MHNTNNSVTRAIALAEAHASNGESERCLRSAVATGNSFRALQWSLQSLSHSVGERHSDFRTVKTLIWGHTS